MMLLLISVESLPNCWALLDEEVVGVAGFEVIIGVEVGVEDGVAGGLAEFVMLRSSELVETKGLSKACMFDILGLEVVSW